MVQKTSWEGTLTKQMRARGMKGAYVRYQDRHTRTGMELVVPKKGYLEVYTPQGVLKRREVKSLEGNYHNYSGAEQSANKNYNAYVKQIIAKRQAQLKQRRK